MRGGDFFYIKENLRNFFEKVFDIKILLWYNPIRKGELNEFEDYRD
jgi:hypothetical protein